MTNELINPTRVVYSAVDIPRDIFTNAFCTDVILVTSNSVKAVPNIKMKPVTVPIKPNTKQDSAINQPGEKSFIATSAPGQFLLREKTFLPIHSDVNIRIPKIKNPILVISSRYRW